MNLLKQFKNYRIERILQLTAHPTYIVLGFLYFYGHQRPLYFYPMLMLVLYFIYFVFMRTANEFYDEAESLLSITPFITAGNLMLNMEAYDFKSYAIAGLLAILSRVFLKTKHGHIFNPGAFGLFAFAMLFPQNGHSSLGLWRSDLIFVTTIFVLGHIVVYKARRLSLIYGYMLGFSFLAIFSSILVKLTGLHLNGLQDMPVMFWPTTLVTSTSFIFIFHVISDPRTSPSTVKEQLIYGCLIGVVDYALRVSLILPAEIIAYIFVQASYGIWKVYSNDKVTVLEKAA